MSMPKYRVRGGPGSEMSSLDLSVLMNKWLSDHGGELVATCATCKHMTKDGPAVCNLYARTPPVAVIVAACPAYDDEHEIPF